MFANCWDANLQRAKKNQAINTRINKIEQADYSFIERFDAFLHKKSLGLKTNHGNYHKKLKSALINAEKQEYISQNPYSKFKLKLDSTPYT
jgi:hypothetical protein